MYRGRRPRTILNRARFIGTNPDPTRPTQGGPEPEAGAMLAFLQAATDVAPTIVCKPNILMLELALRLLGTDPATTLVIGDSLRTDIIGTRAAGLASALVLNGLTHPPRV